MIKQTICVFTILYHNNTITNKGSTKRMYGELGDTQHTWWSTGNRGGQTAVSATAETLHVIVRPFFYSDLEEFAIFGFINWFKTQGEQNSQWIMTSKCQYHATWSKTGPKKNFNWNVNSILPCWNSNQLFCSCTPYKFVGSIVSLYTRGRATLFGEMTGIYLVSWMEISWMKAELFQYSHNTLELLYWTCQPIPFLNPLPPVFTIMNKSTTYSSDRDMAWTVSDLTGYCRRKLTGNWNNHITNYYLE